MQNFAQYFRYGTIAIVVIVLIVILLFGSAFISVVDAGSVGVQKTFGNLGSSVFDPGLHIKSPFTEVIAVPTRVLEYTMSSVSGEGAHIGDDSIQTLTADGSTVWLDVTILYRVNKDNAVQVYENFRGDYEEQFVRPQIRSAIREVISNYAVVEVYSSKRAEVQTGIYDKLKEEFESRGFLIEDVLLRDVVLTDALAQSIAEKLAAQQEAEKLTFEIEKARKEAERKVIEATGQRDSQAIINQSLTPSYLNYLYIQNLQNLEGTIYVPTDPSTGIPLFRGL